MDIENKRNIKTENKGKRLKLGTVIVVAFLLIYLPSLIYWVHGKNIKTNLIRMGTLEDSVSTEGTLIRNEEVLKSDFGGKYIPEIGEGEKVPVNFRVATVLKTSSLNLLESLKEKNLKIIEEQTKRTDNQNIFSEDLSKLEDQIEQRISIVIADCNTNSLANVAEAEEAINGLIQKKAAILGGITTNDAYINTLKNEKEKLESQVKANTVDIVSKSSGIISYIVDGYEEMLNPQAIKELSPKVLEGLKVSNGTGSKENKEVNVGKPFAKVIKDNECYVAVVLEPHDADKFKEGENISLRINDINRVLNDLKVDYKSGLMDGKYVLAVKIDRCVSETAGLRKISIDLVKNSLEGLKVPVKSLMEIDRSNMTAKIILVKANVATPRVVKIDVMNSEYAVISTPEDAALQKKGVSLYDTYVCNPENIEEGQIIIQ